MPIASVTQAARDGAAVQGTYEFWGNVRVQAHEILAAHRDSTLSRVEEHPPSTEKAISWLLLEFRLRQQGAPICEAVVTAKK